MHLPKILKVIFVLLLFITLGEIGYYIYIQIRQPQNLAQLSSSAPTPASTSEIIIPTQGTSNQALSPGVINSLRNVKKGVLTSMILTSEYKGTIAELDTKGGIYQGTGNLKDIIFNYKIKLTIKGEQDSQNTVYFTENDLNKIQIVKIVNDKEATLQFTDLHINDKIITKETIDLTKDINNNLLSEKIIKML